MSCKVIVKRLRGILTSASLVPVTIACFTVIPAPHPAQGTADVANTYILELVAEPSQSASFTLSPRPDSQGAFPPGTTVTVQASVKPGWSIRQWIGPVSRVAERTVQVTMDQNQTLILQLAPAD